MKDIALQIYDRRRLPSIRVFRSILSVPVSAKSEAASGCKSNQKKDALRDEPEGKGGMTRKNGKKYEKYVAIPV